MRWAWTRGWAWRKIKGGGTVGGQAENGGAGGATRKVVARATSKGAGRLCRRGLEGARRQGR